MTPKSTQRTPNHHVAAKAVCNTCKTRVKTGYGAGNSTQKASLAPVKNTKKMHYLYKKALSLHFFCTIFTLFLYYLYTLFVLTLHYFCTIFTLIVLTLHRCKDSAKTCKVNAKVIYYLEHSPILPLLEKL